METINKTMLAKQIEEAARWTARERVALGFSVFFGLIMASAVTDIILGGVITNFLATSIPFIVPVLSFISFPAFPLLISLISAIAVCACLLSLTLLQHKQLKNIVTQITTLTNQQKNENDTKKNISEINKNRNKTDQGIELDAKVGDTKSK